MLTKFIQTSYQKWITENPTTLSIDEFINFASTEFKMTPEDIRTVVEGRRSVDVLETPVNQLQSITTSNTETVIKNYYQMFMKSPVAHTNKSFVSSCAREFDIDEKEVKSLLSTYSWYKLS